jgi:hypothetical protein
MWEKLEENVFLEALRQSLPIETSIESSAYVKAHTRYCAGIISLIAIDNAPLTASRLS